MLAFAFVLVLMGPMYAQTASTGALTGVALDPSGSFLPGVNLQLVDSKSGESRSATADKDGRFSFSFLPPGSYALHVSAASFAPRSIEIRITVTETQRVEIHLHLATVFEQTQV